MRALLKPSRLLSTCAIAVAALALLAGVAWAATTYYGGKNWYSAASVPSNQFHVLTGDNVTNSSCLSNGKDCGVTVCAYALTKKYELWGSRNCASDSAYHKFKNVSLEGVFDEHAKNGAYIYGGLFY